MALRGVDLEGDGYLVGRLLEVLSFGHGTFVFSGFVFTDLNASVSVVISA